MDISVEVQKFLVIVVQGIIPILAGVLVTFASVAAYRVNLWLKANLSKVQLEQAISIIRFLVASAQQSGLSDALLETGNAKKQWVVDQAVLRLREIGLNEFADNIPKIEQLLESEVYRLKQISLPPLGETV